jgi:chromosomal replication initiator protein
MDIELAKEVLKDSISPNTVNEITCPLIIQVVAEHFNISQSDLASKKKSQDIVVPRQIAMYLCRVLTEESLSSIGALLGKRDHTTVIHGHDKIAAELQTNEQLRNTIDVLKKKLIPN